MLFRSQARALAHSASIEVLPCQLFSEHETAGSKLEIRTDADKLHQLLMVFYDNAIRYTPAGGCVTTTITSSPQQLMVSIDDTGIGIGKDERKELFLRHFRGVQARQMRSDGAGLGLAIAKTLAEALGIEIAIESPGKRGCRVNLCHRGK